MKTTAVLLALVAAAASQSCDVATYERCISDSDGFLESTCGPLQTGPRANATLETACQCYAIVNKLRCYTFCSGNATVDAQRAGALTEQTAKCSAAGLNPAALPQPAPWIAPAPVTPVPVSASIPSASATPAVGTAAPTSAATAAPTQPASTPNGAVGVSHFVGLVGASAAFLAAVMIYV
ncbi:hypothetical protein PhCBS80983_g02131 [Powellomyces hirtus]|uniref:Extracellular membrane protein CFEM domain-containing protein n=1 Tax=Powellomyces hirtus TaxID=109895 RepID=A0A507E868_9FUNG|nr:hypothetical protein PhCBS80983_g02131 [Powellomyces hirtus]